MAASRARREIRKKTSSSTCCMPWWDRVIVACVRLFGMRGMAGLTSAMLGSFPGAATFWMTYQASKTYVMPYFHGPVMEPAGHMICAALADVAVCAVRNPFEVVKQQMQVGIHTSTVGAVKEIARVEGLRGFYAGYWSTVLREMPFDALQFALYEALKRKWRERKGVVPIVLVLV